MPDADKKVSQYEDALKESLAYLKDQTIAYEEFAEITQDPNPQSSDEKDVKLNTELTK